MQNIKVLGIIGVRSGSKGVPDKNIRPLAGKPLLGWILETAKKSKYINRLVVSTDSEKYAEIAKNFGAEIPCLRPKELAKDNSTDFEYVKHMADWLEKNEGYRPDIIVRMMATAPFQSVEDLDSVIEQILKDSSVESAVVVAEANQHPMKALRLVDDRNSGKYLVNYFTSLGKDVTPTARQGYEKAYFRANVVACRTEVLKTGTLTGDRVRYHIIPQERAIDIDSEMDFFIAEKLMENFLKGNKI